MSIWVWELLFLAVFLSLRLWDVLSGVDHVKRLATIHHEWLQRFYSNLGGKREGTSDAEKSDNDRGLLLEGTALLWELMFLVACLAPPSLSAFRHGLVAGGGQVNPEDLALHWIGYPNLCLVLLSRLLLRRYLARRG